MSQMLKIAFLVLSSAALSACIAPQTYVDPQYHRASYETIHRLAKPISVKLDTQFQRNGQPLPAADGELRSQVERTLRASGVFIPTADPNAPAIINVVANNIADLAAARGRGFVTGLTFGGAGSMFDDNYEFTFTFHDAANHERKMTYQHAIHTAIGRTERPAGLTPTTTADAFGRVVEDVVLNFVQDLQEKGLASR